MNPSVTRRPGYIYADYCFAQFQASCSSAAALRVLHFRHSWSPPASWISARSARVGLAQPRSSGEFCAQDVDRFDGRWLGQQFRCACHERLSDRSVEMSLAPTFISKGIEDAEGCWPQSQGEPDGRSGFLIRQRQACLEELLQFAFFSGLGFETCE